MSKQMAPEEVSAMAIAIADVAAPEIMLSQAIPVTLDEETWYDLATIDYPSDFEEELRYCEARGLLRHHPERPSLVQG